MSLLKVTEKCVNINTSKSYGFNVMEKKERIKKMPTFALQRVQPLFPYGLTHSFVHFQGGWGTSNSPKLLYYFFFLKGYRGL